MKNPIKQKQFKDMYASSINFSSYLYANIPVKSPSYALSFFVCKNLLKKRRLLHLMQKYNEHSLTAARLKLFQKNFCRRRT